MDHLGMVTAFLNPDIYNDALLMELPEGYPTIEGLMDDCPGVEDWISEVITLQKALYILQ